MESMGGYQTLIMRMSSHLIGEGHSVYLIAQGVDERVRSQFHDELNIQTSGVPFIELYERQAFREFQLRVKIPKVDLIICIDLMAYAVAGFFKLTDSCARARLILGLFQPDSVRQARAKSATGLLVRAILSRSGCQTSVVAMTKRLKTEWDSFFGPHYSAHFIPLPVDLEPFQAIQRKPQKYRIVSVGRLDDYKTYNVYMIRILKSLVAKGYDIVYDIYGEGPYRERIETEIDDCGLEGRVRLKGMLPYIEYPKILETAYAFVGMGTAAIEAAAAGVPTIYAAPRDMTSVTHGMLHHFDLTEKGGFASETSPPLRVESVLLQLLKLNDAQYTEESQASRAAMELYSLKQVMDRYSRVFDSTVAGTMQSGLRLRLLPYLVKAIRTIRSFR